MSVSLLGQCLTGTRRNIIAGIRGSRISGEAIDAVIAQAATFLRNAIEAYDTDVALNEIGEGGTARASDSPPERGCPTALLYGRVQSGKTAAMIMTTALALDNGFRVDL